MNTFKQIILGMIIISSLYCSIYLGLMREYIAGIILFMVFIYTAFYGIKTVQQLIRQQVTQNVSRETSTSRK
jgi:hypothetical protein